MNLAPIAIVVPVLTAVVLVAFGSHVPRVLADGVAIVASLATVVLCALLLAHVWDGTEVTWLGGWHPRQGGVAVGIDLAVDPLGAGAATFAALMATAALVYSIRYLEAVAPMYEALMLLMMAGMVGLCLTGDLFNLFVFFELLSVPAYALTAYRVEHGGPLQGGLGFALTNSIGSFLVVSGIGLLYGRAGALNLAQIGEALAGHAADGLVVVAFTFVAAGFLIKSATVPFHFWLADAYSAAPIPVCVLFSGAAIELGLFALARIQTTVFSGVADLGVHAVGVVLVALAMLTCLVGAVMAFLQHRLKRLLAFSTIAHSGMLLTGVAVLDAHGIGAAALLGLTHGLIMASLFMAVGLVSRRLGSVSERRLHGRGRGHWALGVAMAAGGLGLAGLPPLGVFAGKSLIEEAATARGWWYVPLVFVMVSALTGGAVLRATARVFLGLGAPAPADPLDEDDAGAEGEDRPAWDLGATIQLATPMVVLLVAGLTLGAVPQLRHGVERAAVRFADRPAYVATVLEGRPSPAPQVKPASGPHTSSSIYSLVAVAGAFAAAGAALFAPRTRPVLVLRRAGGVLQAWHTGHLGDYATWAVVGVVALGWALAATAG